MLVKEDAEAGTLVKKDAGQMGGEYVTGN